MADVYIVSEWLRYAWMDYDVALHDTTFHPLPVEIICYHCQQAAEKALKAVLIHHKQEVPYIHDTLRLWKLATTLEPTLSSLRPQSSYLRRFASVERYPNELELNEGDMKRALDDAKAIVETIEALWKSETADPNSSS